MRAPLLLTGGPAAGKSTTARRLADGLPLAAVVDVDDVRQLVTSGHVAPWQGDEGTRQHRLGVENACDLARRFTGAGIDVVLSDVVSRDTEVLYRRLLRGVVVVRLLASLAEARLRARSRPAFITDQELDLLHRLEAHSPAAADHTLDVGTLGVEEQVRAVHDLWTRQGSRR